MLSKCIMTVVGCRDWTNDFNQMVEELKKSLIEKTVHYVENELCTWTVKVSTLIITTHLTQLFIGFLTF